MSFSCWITKANIQDKCKVTTCMWSSCVNKKGCMADPEPPEPHLLTESLIAKHKGLSLEQLTKEKATAQKRIKSLLILNRYLDWCQNKEKVWSEACKNKEVIDLCSNLCKTHWPFNVEDLGWKVHHIAWVLHRPTVTKFLASTNKELDWLEVIELDLGNVLGIVSVFKRAELKSKGLT